MLVLCPLTITERLMIRDFTAFSFEHTCNSCGIVPCFGVLFCRQSDITRGAKLFAHRWDILMNMRVVIAVLLIAVMPVYAQARSAGKVSKGNGVPNWDVSSSCRAVGKVAYSQDANEREKSWGRGPRKSLKNLTQQYRATHLAIACSVFTNRFRARQRGLGSRAIRARHPADQGHRWQDPAKARYNVIKRCHETVDVGQHRLGKGHRKQAPYRRENKQCDRADEFARAYGH